MKTVSISTLKARLSEFLDAVRQGQDVLVTDRGRPIARITPIRDRQQEQGRRDLLMRTGRLRAPRRRAPKDLYARALPADPEGRVLAALLEERRKGPLRFGDSALVPLCLRSQKPRARVSCTALTLRSRSGGGSQVECASAIAAFSAPAASPAAGVCGADATEALDRGVEAERRVRTGTEVPVVSGDASRPSEQSTRRDGAARGRTARTERRNHGALFGLA